MIAQLERYHRERIQTQFFHLSRATPREQAEAIARHYLAHANQVLDLAEILKYRHHATPADEMRAGQFVEHLVRTIKANHAHDFGILLDWPPIR